MAMARPKFPVIDLISGLNEWIDQASPLTTMPKGITIHGQDIAIKLTKDHPHPLFRFCLELFSIIPKKCVDLKTNKLTCEKLPESGRYTIESRKDNLIQFKRRSEMSGPEAISFKYVSAVQLPLELASVSSNSVIAGNESMYSFDDLEKFRKFDSFYYLPASRFAVLQISPEIAPFNDKLCRAVFANQFRQEYNKLTTDNSPAESSIFTKIISGYLTRKDLEANIISKLKKSEIDSCVQKLRKNDVKWGYVENEKNSAFVSAFKNTLKSFELKGEPQVFKTRKDQSDKFSAGELAVLNAGSGFWANDPVGDLQMLFTPNLHKALNFITKDDQLQKLIQNLVSDQTDQTKYLAVNKYLHDQAMFNVYTHVRRFYFSKDKNRLKQIPQGSAAPAPWQVFE